MMKKLLVLMLVLGLASAVNAAIIPGSFSIWVSPTGVAGSYVEGVDSLVTLTPGQTFWIGIHNSVQGVEGAGPPSNSTQMGSVLLGIQNTIVGYKGEDPIYHADTVWTMLQQTYRKAQGGPLVDGAPVPANEYWGIGDVGAPGGVPLSVWNATLTDGSPVGFNSIGVLDAKQLECVGPASDDVIWLLNADDGAVFDTLVIHQVPEPMTIMLLGLGGLFLHRRKK